MVSWNAFSVPRADLVRRHVSPCRFSIQARRCGWELIRSVAQCELFVRCEVGGWKVRRVFLLAACWRLSLMRSQGDQLSPLSIPLIFLQLFLVSTTLLSFHCCGGDQNSLKPPDNVSAPLYWHTNWSCRLNSDSSAPYKSRNGTGRIWNIFSEAKLVFELETAAHFPLCVMCNKIIQRNIHEILSGGS